MPANALLRARFQRLLSLLLLLSCGPSSGVRVSPWRAVAHRLSPRLSDRGAALPGAFSPLRGNLMFWKARGEQPMQPTLTRSPEAAFLSLCSSASQGWRHHAASHPAPSRARRQPDCGRAGLRAPAHASARAPLRVARGVPGAHPVRLTRRTRLARARSRSAAQRLRADGAAGATPQRGGVRERSPGASSLRALLHHYVAATNRRRQRGANAARWCACRAPKQRLTRFVASLAGVQLQPELRGPRFQPGSGV